MKRAHISVRTKLAAALLTMVRPDENGNMVPVISHEEAKRMTADEVIAAFDFDHDHPHALGGDDHHSNLTPRPRAEHRERTAKIDVPRIAKTKRLEKSHIEFQARMLAKSDRQPIKPTRPKQKIPSRPMGKRKQK